MPGAKDLILFKGQKFIEDFKSLNSSYTEVVESLKKVGLSASIFYNWTHRMDADGNSRTSSEILHKLCDVSGLTYEDYYIKPFKKRARRKKGERVFVSPEVYAAHVAKVNSHKMKNGVVVTTYTSNPAAKKDIGPEQVDELHSKISSFRSHLIVYRKLLGLSKTDMQQALSLDTYPDVESGNAIMSVSTYIKISNLLMKTYTAMPDSSITRAFNTLATEYADIYIQSIFFGNKSSK